MIRFLPLAILAVFVSIADTQAQLFRRGNNCPGGVCPAPIVIEPIIVEPIFVGPPVAVPAANSVSDWYKILRVPSGYRLTTAEDQLIRSWAKRAVRVINGSSCGTGSLCGRDANSIYILTNAHVASSRIGNVVRCEALLADESGTEKFDARVIESAYSSRTATDWALLRADARYMTGIDPIQLSTTAPEEGELTGTWGCPRCEVPSGQLVVTERLGSIWYWQPNSIGGQSGSAVIQGGQQKGLLTWTIAGDGAGQLTETIYRQSTRGNTDGPARVPGMLPSIDFSYADVELIEGYQSETDIHDYPIWAEIEPIPNPEPDPGPCPEMSPEEKRLRDRLRERGIDWVTLIRLILEIVDLIGKGRG